MRHSHQIAPRAPTKPRPWYRPAGWRPLWAALAVSVAVHASGLILLHRGRRVEIPVIAVALYAGDDGGNGGAAGVSGDAGASADAGDDAGSTGLPMPDPVDRDESSAAVPVEPEPTRKSPPPAKPVPRAIARSDVERDPAPPEPGHHETEQPSERVGFIPASSSSGAGPAAAGGVATAHQGAGGRGPGGAGPGSGGGGARGDLRGNCLACPVPAYPRQARRHGWQGFVDLRLRLDGTGKVAAVTVERSSGFKVLDDAAVAAARRSRFRILSPVHAPDAWGRMRYRFEIGSG